MEADRLDADALRALPNLASIRAVAERLMPSALRLYVGYGAEDEETVASNTRAWSDWSLRPRVLTATGAASTACTVLGCPVASPVLIAPFAGALACHPDGEAAVARAAGSSGSGFTVPHFGGVTMEEVDGNRERTYKSAPWLADVGAQLGAMPHVVTLQQAAGVPARHPGMCSVMGWADVSWIRSITGMKVVVKGVMTAEDARIATEHCDAIVVSNHGGRQLDGCDATAHVLHECVQAADGKIEVFVDGGVRRGKDVFRALALGASAVLIGRPAAYGLAAGGEHGVARVLELLREELATVMQLCGCAAVRDISEAHVRRKKNGEA